MLVINLLAIAGLVVAAPAPHSPPLNRRVRIDGMVFAHCPVTAGYMSSGSFRFDTAMNSVRGAKNPYPEVSPIQSPLTAVIPYAWTNKPFAEWYSHSVTVDLRPEDANWSRCCPKPLSIQFDVAIAKYSAHGWLIDGPYFGREFNIECGPFAEGCPIQRRWTTCKVIEESSWIEASLLPDSS